MRTVRKFHHLAASLLLGDPSGVATTAWSLPLLGAVAYMVVLATVVPMFLLVAAITRVGAAKAGVVSTLEPVVAAGGAWIFLAEAMRPTQWLGGLLILVAIWFVYRAPVPAKVPRVQTVDIAG